MVNKKLVVVEIVVRASFVCQLGRGGSLLSPLQQQRGRIVEVLSIRMPLLRQVGGINAISRYHPTLIN